MNDLALMSWEGDADFSGLSDKGRMKVRSRCAAVQRILKASRGKIGEAERREARELGVCHSAMRGLVKAYEEAQGDWHSMIDWRCEPHKDQQQPPAFLDFWRMLVEDNQRKSKPAWRELRRLYWSRATHYVSPKGWSAELWPGYAARPEPSALTTDGMPRGWSYSNLMLHAPTKVELLNARLGPIAASELQEMVFTSRRGLRPGQHYIPDDCWVDLKVTVSPSLSRFPVRPVELGCGDLASGKKIAWGLTPMITDDEGKRNYIKKRDMRYLLAKILCVVGFHRDGLTLWVEHGSAGIWPELEEQIVRLAAACGYSIRVKRSGITGGKAFGGGYETLGKGNFRLKAAYESNHNLAHNERGNLPGQTGNNSRLNVVEEMTGRDREATEILTAALALRPAVRDELRTGYTTFANYFSMHTEVERRIANYTDHELQGWEEAGFMVSEFRMAADGNAPWMPMAKLLELSPEQRAVFDVMFERIPGLTRTRRMSRHEAWLSGEADLVRLPLHCVPEILGREFAKDRPVGKDGMFTFQDQDCGPEELVFRAKAKTPAGTYQPLGEGIYRTWVNPFDQSLLFVATPGGNYIGTCELKDRLERGDEEAFQREVVAVRQEHAEKLAPALSRQRRRNRQVTEDRKHNIRLLDNGPATEAEKAFAEHDTALALTDCKDVSEPVQEPGTDDFNPLDPSNLLD